MQQAIPYRAWGPQHTSPSSSPSSPSCSTVTGGGGGGGGSEELVKRMIAENPVLVVGRRGCCMSHVVKRLLQGLGVNPAVCEVGEEIDETSLIDECADQDQQQHTKMTMFPAVFIGGRLVGGLDRLMAVHISGDLVPILKDAGALWL